MKIGIQINVFLASILLPFLMLGQDIHLAHIHASPTLLNPAMTGLFDGDMRFIGNARSQWNSVTNGYKTAVGSMDMKLRGIGTNDFIGGGFQLYADRAGDLDFTTRSAALTFSYLKSLDRQSKNFFSIGIQNAFVNTSLDYSKIIAFDNIPALEGDVPDNVNYWDLSAGVAWFYKYNKYNIFHLGATYSHLNNPVVSFLNRENPNRANILYRKWVFHGGATIKVADGFDIKPTFMFLDQGPHREITLGTFGRYKTVHRKKRRRPVHFVYLGAWLRWYLEKDMMGADAIIASLRYDYRTLYITVSYDINISKWTFASGGRGGPEVSIVKVIKSDKNYRKRTKIKCPAVYW